MKRTRPYHIKYAKKLRLILLPLLMLTILTGTFSTSVILAENGDKPAEKAFPASERVRTEVEFEFTYPNQSLHIAVTVNQTSFDTGEMIKNTYDFESPSLNSKYRLDGITRFGRTSVTPAGLKSYVVAESHAGIDYILMGSTVYEFDLKTRQLRKVTDMDKIGIRVYGELGFYETIQNAPPYNNLSTDKHQLYGIQSNKPLLPPGNFEFLGKIPLQNNPVTNYITYGKALSDKGAKKTYLVSSGGKLTPVSKIYNQFTHDKDPFTHVLELANGKGQLMLKQSRKSGQSHSTVIWTKGGAQKTLLDVPGRINDFDMPSFSPNNRYMLIYSEITGEHLAFVDGTYYIFDLKTMTLIQKVKPNYKLKTYGVEWYGDELVRFFYDTSRQDDFPPMYYHIPTQTSIASRESWFHDPYLDNFTYEGMASADVPLSLRVDGQNIRYSRIGAMRIGDSNFIPLRDFAEQQGITVNISTTELELSKGDKRTVISLTKAKSIGGNWFIPIKELLPLGYILPSVNSSYIWLKTADKAEQ